MKLSIPSVSTFPGNAHDQRLILESPDTVMAAHRPSQTPSPVAVDSCIAQALLSAYLAHGSSHSSSPPMLPMSARPHVTPLVSSPPLGSREFRVLPRLPALSTVLTFSAGAVAHPPCKGVAHPALAVLARKKYRDRFSIDEEEALVAFWFKYRFKFSMKSKILWRLAERNGITQRDAISVQKHFDHMLKHGRMRELFRTFRRKGKLGDIIDHIDVERDFMALPNKSPQDGRPAARCTDSDDAAASDAETAIHTMGGSPRGL